MSPLTQGLNYRSACDCTNRVAAKVYTLNLITLIAFLLIPVFTFMYW